MRLIVTRIIVLLLLPAFILASASEVLGFSWCVGNDGHVELERGTNHDCGAENFANENFGRNAAPIILGTSNECCGPCLDLSIQNEAYIIKRLKKITVAPTDAISLNVFPRNTVRKAHLLVSNLITQHPPRISKTILAHRTVVLLN
jgi:hypothetical protein